MGVVQLPTYEAQEVEIGTKLPSREAEFNAMAAVGRAQRATLEMGLDALTTVGKTIINKARNDEYTKAVTSYTEWSTNRLRELEERPIQPGDPEYEELTAEERANPNTAVFNKERKIWLQEHATEIFWPKVKDAFAQWTSERAISENDGLLRFDYVKSHEVALDTYQEAALDAIDSGNLGLVKDLADSALAADVITQKQYDDNLDLAYKDVTKKSAKLKALSMGDQGLAWISNADNTSYETYDGKKKMLPLDEHTALVKEFEALRQAKADEQDTIFSDKFVRANTVEEINALEAELIENPYMLGTQKRTWDSWIQDKKGRILTAQPTGPSVANGLFSRLYKAKDAAKNPGIEVPISEIDEKISDPQEHQALLAKRNELQSAYEAGGHATREDVFYEAYRIANDPFMSEDAKNKWVDDHTVMGGGLSPDDGMKVKGWIKPYNDNASRKRAMDSIQQAYTISMQNETDKTKQLKIALDLYHAQIALDKMFTDPKTTQAHIDAAVAQFLEAKVITDIMTELKRRTGGAGFPVAGREAGIARELETAREVGLFPQFPERAAEFEAKYRPEAIKQERAELKNQGIAYVKEEMNEFGDQVYTDANGVEYVVLQKPEIQKNGKTLMVEKVYTVEYRTLNGVKQMRYVVWEKK